MATVSCYGDGDPVTGHTVAVTGHGDGGGGR